MNFARFKDLGLLMYNIIKIFTSSIGELGKRREMTCLRRLSTQSRTDDRTGNNCLCHTLSFQVTYFLKTGKLNPIGILGCRIVVEVLFSACRTLSAIPGLYSLGSVASLTQL